MRTWHTASAMSVTFARVRSGSPRKRVNERLLVLVNLDSKPVTAYTLALEKGGLAAGMRPAVVLGQADKLTAPEVNAAGGFAGYQPVGMLPPRGTVGIQFVK